jgi:hypothetical protein
VTARWIAPVAVMTVLLAASCGQQHEPRTSRDPGGRRQTGIVPFGTFLASVRSASYHDYAGRPGTRVRSREAFDQMRGFLLDSYQGARVVRSYATSGAVFDCINQCGTAAPPSPASAPAGSAAAASPASEAAAPPQTAAPAQTTACPHGSVPVRRITLANLVQFPTLEQFLGKSPGGGGQLPLPGHTTRPGAKS